MTKCWAGVEWYNSAFFGCTRNVGNSISQNSGLIVDGEGVEVSDDPLFAIGRNSSAQTDSNAVIMSRSPSCFARRFLLLQAVKTRVLGETPMTKHYSSMFVGILE